MAWDTGSSLSSPSFEAWELEIRRTNGTAPLLLPAVLPTEESQSMQAAIAPWGKVVLEEKALRLKGLMSDHLISYEQITSININKLLARLTIETPAGKRSVQLWNRKEALQIADAVKERLD